MLPLIGGLLSAGSTLLGGLMGQSAADKARKSQEAANKQNYEAQKEFAQNGLRWKVEDATKAGVHPLYAVGAPTQSFQASFAGSPADMSMPNALAGAGQDIGRAVAATQTAPEKALMTLQLERAGLENDLLRTQIRRQVMETGPTFPTASGDPATLSFHGMNWRTNPDTSPAQKIQDRYGDIVESLYGLGVVGSDMVHNAVPTPNRPPEYRGQPDYHGMNKRGFIEQLGYATALDILRRELMAK